MSYLGAKNIDDGLTFYANTTRFDTGAATDADAVPAYRVYEEETGTAILTGDMSLLDSGNTAGFYSEKITLSAANGFEVGKCYAIYISATVNSVAGATHHSFSVVAPPALESTAQSIVSDTNDIQTRLPAALTAGGNMKSDTLAISGSTLAADNAEVVFANDFAVNYNITLAQWIVDVANMNSAPVQGNGTAGNLWRGV